MLFLIDTCFWNNIQSLYNQNKQDFRPLLTEFRWGFTPQVKIELQHFKLWDFINSQEAFSIPISDKELIKMQQNHPTIVELDLADQELYLAALRDKFAVLTDDRALFFELFASHLPAMSLPDFLLFLIKNNRLDKRECYRSLRFWEKQRTYKKKTLKRIKSELEKII
jgi:hypothetical protein